MFFSAPSVLMLCLRFLMFLFKITCAGVFVMFLQIQIGEKTLEEWIEGPLRHSSFSQMVRNKLVPKGVKIKDLRPDAVNAVDEIVKQNSHILKEAGQKLQEDIKNF